MATEAQKRAVKAYNERNPNRNAGKVLSLTIGEEKLSKFNELFDKSGCNSKSEFVGVLLKTFELYN